MHATHPSAEQLRNYLLGKLPLPEGDQVADHLDNCDDCEVTIAAFDAEVDTLVSQLSKRIGTGAVHDSQLQRALDFVKRIGREVSLPGADLATDQPLGQLREYRLLEKLGEGGMGAVYKALHTRLNKVVAVKVLPKDKMQSPGAVARFEREMLAVGNLDHPHLIRAHDAGEVEGTHFLVMEYVAGCDLSQLVKQRGPLPIADACEAIRQAALGLQEAHTHGLVHRDIKPSNLMLTTKGQVKVLDLGLALLADQDKAHDLTSTGQLMGTIDYMAPEQGGDSHRVDIRADIYSLGSTLYKLLTGDAPFAGAKYDSLMKKMIALSTETPTPLSQKRGDVPIALSDFVQTMLAKEAADRPATSADVAAALAPFCAGANLINVTTEPGISSAELPTAANVKSVSAETIAAPTRTPEIQPLVTKCPPPKRPRSRGMLVAAGGAAALLLLGAIVLIVRNNKGEEVARIPLQPGDTIELREDDSDSTKPPSTKMNPAPSDPLPPKVTVVPATAGDAKPVVIFRAGQKFRDFKQLSGALAEMDEGDVIEIHSNDSFLVSIADVFSKTLYIRAGEGFRPRLVAAPGRPSLRGGVKISGCDLNFREGDWAMRGPSAVIDNCRIQGTALVCYAPTLRISNSLILLGQPIAIEDTRKISLTNCLLYTQSWAFNLNSTKDVEFDLLRNTFYLESPGESALIGGSKDASAKVIATGNVFHSHSQSDFFAMPDWKKNIQWSGSNNLYSGKLFHVFNEQGELVRRATIDDWNQLWAKPEIGSQVVEQFEPLFVHLTHASLGELRTQAEPIIARHRSQFQLPNLGPDWTTIGCGPGYVAALTAAAKKSAELRPEVSSGGPYALFRNGKEEASFPTIEAALAAAQDRDVIELRTDAKLESVGLVSEKPRHLTLRAAIGYSPQINNMANGGKDLLELEGLTFGGVVAGTARMGKEWSATGGIHRLTNCEFNVLSSRFFNDGNQPATITNCRITHLTSVSTKGQNLTVDNCVLQRVDITGEAKDGGKSVFDHCLFWNLESHFTWRARLPSTHTAFHLNHDQDVLVRDCFFAPPSAIAFHPNYVTRKSPCAWKGERNVYSIPTSYLYGVTLTTLEGWRKLVTSEQDSHQVDPVLLDPHFWKLMPKSPGSGEGANGSDMGADISTIAVIRPAAISPIQTPSPAVIDKPFVLLRDGQEFRAFKHLAGVVAELKAGDAIEIRSNGPVALDLEDNFSKSLDIRAGQGYRPRLKAVEQRRILRGSVMITGCDLDLRSNEVWFAGPRLELNNCRYQGFGLQLFTPVALFRNSLIITDGGVTYNNVREITFSNCLVKANDTPLNLRESPEVQIQLDNNTFYLESQGQGRLLSGDEKSKPIVKANANIIHQWTQAEFIGVPNWRKTLQWQGRGNLYSGGLFYVTNDQGENWQLANLEDWNALLKEPETGSQRVTQFEPLFVHLTEAPIATLRVQVEPIVAETRRRHNLPTLGLNWDHLGPGDAYLATLTAAGKQPVELRPEVLAGGPIVLIRDDKELRGYRSIPEALQDAQDRDIIELRTDDELINFAIDGDKPCHLTLRAAPGYLPKIAGFQNQRGDTLNLEGINFTANIVGGPWDGKALLKSGGVHRVANCEVKSIYSRFINDGDKSPIIANSRFLQMACLNVDKTTVSVDNCLLLRVDIGNNAKSEGKFEFDHCEFWNLEPHFTWRPNLGNTYSIINTQDYQDIRVRDCFLAAPNDLVLHLGIVERKFPVAWRGERNAYSIPFAYNSGCQSATLEQWKMQVSSEQDSVEVDPILFAPRFWKLMPSTPGAGEGPEGTDLGADVNKVATPPDGRNE